MNISLERMISGNERRALTSRKITDSIIEVVSFMRFVHSTIVFETKINILTL